MMLITAGDEGYSVRGARSAEGRTVNSTCAMKRRNAQCVKIGHFEQWAFYSLTSNCQNHILNNCSMCCDTGVKAQHSLLPFAEVQNFLGTRLQVISVRYFFGGRFILILLIH